MSGAAPAKKPLGDAFCPAWLDDYGLRPPTFRVYLHLRRRADATRSCFPSVRSIAGICKINKDTVTAAIAELEGLGFIRRQSGKKGRKSNDYYLCLPSEIVRKEGTLTQEPVSEKEDNACPESGDSTVRNGGAPKVLQGKGTPEEGTPYRPSASLSELSEEQQSMKTNQPNTAFDFKPIGVSGLLNFSATPTPWEVRWSHAYRARDGAIARAAAKGDSEWEQWLAGVNAWCGAMGSREEVQAWLDATSFADDEEDAAYAHEGAWVRAEYGRIAAINPEMGESVYSDLLDQAQARLARWPEHGEEAVKVRERELLTYCKNAMQPPCKKETFYN